MDLANRWSIGTFEERWPNNFEISLEVTFWAFNYRQTSCIYKILSKIGNLGALARVERVVIFWDTA